MTPLLRITVLSMVLYVSVCSARSLQVGTSVNGTLAFVEEVKLTAIPFTTRTKNVFYTGDKVIKGISAIDRANSEGKVTITSGGVGFIFTNIRLKSARGDGLEYQVQVFV